MNALRSLAFALAGFISGSACGLGLAAVLISLLDRAGMIDGGADGLSGAVLFFGTTYALGSRHLIRNAIISIALSVGTWYLFNLALGIALPVGILKGIL